MKSLPVLFSLISALALAQNEPPLLTAELVPETPRIAPGKPFTVAVKLKHIEHGHSYWINPGGPGSITKFKWTLPEGFTASPPAWPTPEKGDAAGFVAYLYSGEVYPLVTFTPSATIKAGDTIALEGEIKALVCIDTCTPVKLAVKTQVPVADAPGEGDAATKALFAKARAALPVETKGWTFTAEQKDKTFAIVLKPGTGANTKLSKAYFFSSLPGGLTPPDQDIDSQKPQELKKDGDHWVLSLPPTADNPPKDALEGLLVAEEGWLEGDATTKAFSVKLPLGAPGAATTTQGGQTGASATATEPTTGGRSLGTLLLFAFIGGLILNVMPCVFPVLGIKILGFVQQAGHDRKKIFLHGLAYTLGVLVCFWALALFVITLGKGWGAQLQSPLFVLGLCYFFMAFGLNMAGVFEIGTSAIGVGQELQNKSGLKGSFFSGLLATVVATPCSAPFLGPALAYAVSLPTALALGVFTVIGLGLSSPYLILSLAPQLVRMLPRPGAWMESFKQGMSFLLFGTVGYMLWIYAGMVGERNLLMAIFGAVLVAFGCWVYGRWCLPHKSAKARTLSLGFTILALAGGLYLGWPRVEEKWSEWSPELVQELRDAGTPVYIDFTARWCATCQTNHRVYGDEDLKSLFKKKGVKLLKADWTNYDERITEVLRKEYHKAAVPVNVYYPPGAKEPVILPEFLTVDNVSAALAK